MVYQLTSTAMIVRGADNATIPADPRNADYQAYLAWVAAGNTPTPVTPPSLAELKASLAAAASAAASAIVAQVMPDAAHQAAVQNAASIVNGNGGSAPSSGPMAAKFTALAATYGMTSSAFAALVLAMQGASFDLSAALASLSVASASATSTTDLASALAAFETAIVAVVAEVNAASPPMAIASPAAISIAGINS